MLSVWKREGTASDPFRHRAQKSGHGSQKNEFRARWFVGVSFFELGELPAYLPIGDGAEEPSHQRREASRWPVLESQ